jgi:hypothetical protein
VHARFKAQFNLPDPRRIPGAAVPVARGFPKRPLLGRFRKLIQPRARLSLKFTISKARGLRFGAPARRPRPLVAESVQVGTNFSLLAGGKMSAHAGVSKEAALIEAIRRQTPFETYRPTLWRKLTHR